MLSLKRPVFVVLTAVAVGAGTLLIMGNLRSSDHAIQLEQARTEGLARTWESRLGLARSTFRDMMVRYDLIAILDHPEEWSTPRISAKFQDIATSWGKEAGVPKAMILIRSDGTIHSMIGDTLRLAEAAAQFSGIDKPDLIILPRSGKTPEYLALLFEPPPIQVGHRPARLIALVEPSGFTASAKQPPAHWTLLAGPNEALIVTSGGAHSLPVTEAAWPLLVSEGSGTIPLQDGRKMCFARVQIPGMKPMLVVQPLKPRSAAAIPIALLLIASGSAGLIWLSLSRFDKQSGRNSTPGNADESAGFRQAFHAIDDPICIVDAHGRVLRANNKAHQWFHFQKGAPKENLSVWRPNSDILLSELLDLAAADPEAASGPFGIVLDGRDIQGSIQVVRLGNSEQQSAPVLIHFRPAPSPQVQLADTTPISPEDRAFSTDPTCPYPTIEISPEGIVVGFNLAARKACPRLDESPIISDILPELGETALSALFEAEEGAAFESLFGRQVHRFIVVSHGGGVILYGHPLSESKNLEIELHQAQESFHTLCALCTQPVILTDPRDHLILEANAAAGDLFECAPAALRGQTLESLAAQPCELNPSETVFLAQTLSGRVVECQLRYELIKVEGAPTLLICLEVVPELPYTAAAQFAENPLDREPMSDSSEIPVMPMGPGLLITLSPTVRETARRMLEKTGHSCESFSRLDDVTIWLITHDVRPELVVIDLTDFDEVGSWLEDLRIRCGDVPCLAFTDGELYELPNSGCNAFLAKPFDFESLTAALSDLHLVHELTT